MSEIPASMSLFVENQTHIYVCVLLSIAVKPNALWGRNKVEVKVDSNE